MSSTLYVIVVGSDPSSGRGGIANALPGYFRALGKAGLSFVFLKTHDASSWSGKWRYWPAAALSVVRQVRAARRTGARMVMYAHVGGGVPSFVRKASLALLVRIAGTPVVMQLHGPEVAGYLASSFGCRLFRMATSPATAICVLTPWWKDLLNAAGIRKPVFVVPNPLDEHLEEIARTPIVRGTNERGLMILAMARVEDGKGVDLLIEAMPHLPEPVRCVVAGDGGMLPKLRIRAVQLGIGRRVSFLGWVSGEEKLRLLRGADIFCLPSSSDSFGMGFMEAMAHGLAVIALDWGPIHDVVPDGECGILIKQPTPRQLANAIKKLLGDSELRIRMGRNGQRWVRQRFLAETVGKEIRKVMEVVSL